jgi:hypothetical protein
VNGRDLMLKWFPAAVATLVVLALATFAAAQQTTGVLRGQILDPANASVPKVAVTVTGPDNITRTTQSDDGGAFVFLGLLEGGYSVRASAAGFAAFEQQLNVPSGRITTLEIRLAVQLQRQEITVAGGEQTQLEVDPSRNANTLTVEGKDLDMLADNPDDLQADLLALAGPSAGPNGGQIFVDGFSNGELPAKETIREVRVNNNPFSSEFDTMGMGRVEVLTRPGTDRFRGSAQFNFADAALNARNPYAPAKPPTQMRQYAFNLTGPLTKKASFNLDASHASQDTSALVNADILGSNLQIQHVSQILPAPNTRTNFSPRIDYALTPNVTLQGRYSWFQNSTGENGVGGFTLPSRATTSDSHHQSVQFTETQVIGSHWIDENRFQFHRAYTDQFGDSSTPAINVLGAFTGGGAPFSHNYLDDRSSEFQNMSSFVHGTNLMKFGIRVRATSLDNYSTSNFNGTFTFTSLAAYASALAGSGGAPAQYSVTAGKQLASVRQVDAAPWIQDDWRMLPYITLSMGLRYEIQTNLSDKRAWAPRASIAWGIGKSPAPGRTPKTVLRVGAGIFYSRIDQSWTLQAERQNGINQQFFVIDNPAFFPAAPSPAQLAASLQPQAIQLLDPAMTSPRILQGAVTLERQLPKNITVSATYSNYRGVHQSLQRDINTPFPGTFTGLPGSGVFPYHSADPLMQYETAGMFKQTQFTAQVNARVNPRFSLFGYFNWNHADSNTDGPGSYLSNAYNAQADWGRSIYDVRLRGQIGGNITLPFGIQLAPNISASSAPPFNITTGTDLNGDTLYLDRPAYATVPANPANGIVATRWGVFNLNPVNNPGAGTVIIPRDLGVGYGTIMVSGRISRTWGFGERPTPARQNGAGGAAASGAGNKRVQLTAGIQGRNWLNHVNPGAPTGNLSSPFFGTALNLQTGNGSTANRRLELNLRLSF